MKPAALLIAGKDLRETRGDGRALLVWVLAVLALVVAALQGNAAWRAAESERDAVSAHVRQQWDTQGDKNPHRGAHFGQYAFKPTALPGFIDPGVNAQAGRAIWLDPHRRNLSRFKPAEDGTSAARLAPASVATVLQWVLPLLVIALSFGAVAGEREGGTWRLLASLGVTPARLFAGKLAGTALVLIPMLLFLTVAALLALAAPDGGGDAAVRIGAMALLYSVYLLIFGGLALGVSARTASASRALAVLLVLWGLNGFVAPRLGGAIADAAVSLPSSETFHAAIHHDIQYGMNDDGDANARDARFLAGTLAKYGVARPEDLPVALRGLRLIANDAYSSRVHDKHFSDLAGRFVAQADWQLAAAVAGPLLPVRALSQALAGTDLHHHLHFADAAEQYRRTFIDATSEEIARRNTGIANSATVGNDYWRAVPPFDYRSPGVGWALTSQWRALLVLALWLAAALAFAVSGFTRLTREI